MFKCSDENEESSLLQTIRIPKNLLFLPDKLPQPNYEKKILRKNNSNSFTDDNINNKDSLPEINKMSQKNAIRKRSDKKYDKDSHIPGISNSDKKEKENSNSEERERERERDKDHRENNQNIREHREHYRDRHNHDRNSLGNPNNINILPTQNNQNNNDDSNLRINNHNEIITIPKKKRRIENNDRSLDNIISHNIYSNALNGSGIANNNNIKILKSENYEISNNNSMLRDKSPYEDSPNLNLKKKKDFMMLPNIRHQQNHENR